MDASRTGPSRWSPPIADLASIAEGDRSTLQADCERCVALCCVAPALVASADFAIDKPAGVACPHLTPGFGCGIHERLRAEGFPGCAAYDCFGAGQVVTASFGGDDWRRTPAIAEQMFAAFAVQRQLHELAWYLGEALALPAAAPLHPALRAALAGTGRLAELAPAALADVDVASHRQQVGALLGRSSALVRARPGPDHRGADLIGRNLAGANLRGATFRGAALLGADLRGADLRLADLLVADLRGADLRGADLSTSLFVTRSQLGPARGDTSTVVPAVLERPAHWGRPAPGVSPAGGRRP